MTFKHVKDAYQFDTSPLAFSVPHFCAHLTPHLVVVQNLSQAQELKSKGFAAQT